jgi:hypothetical protein
VIVADEAERQACVDAGAPLDRLLLLDDFQDGPLDLRRSGWRQTQRLDLLTNDEARALVGGVVRYAKKLVVADKMIGVSAKDGSTKVGKHLSGVGYLIEAWAEASPYAGIIPLEIEIMTVAGSAGARAGFVDPILVRSAITSAMRVVDRNRRLGHLTITLKQDGEVPIFNDRLLVCGRRTWGIQHGFDDLGKLGRSGIRRPTMIDPPSDARGTVFRDIQSLRDL